VPVSDVLDTGLRLADIRKASASTDCGRGLEKNSLFHFLGFDRVVCGACKHLRKSSGNVI